LKVTGLPETAKPSFKIQISSPIEEISITKIFDPLDPKAEGSVATIRGVDTKVATLSVTSANDADIYLGSSLEHVDISAYCNFDALASKRSKISEVEVTIVADDDEKKGGDDEDDTIATPPTPPAADEQEAAKENSTADQDESSTAVESEDKSTIATSDETKETETNAESSTSKSIEDEDKVTTNSDPSPSTDVPICVITLRIEFVPSKEEERDALYELLNTASKEKK